MADGGKAGQGHPLPASEEARTDELPEHLVEEKGQGDDSGSAIQPDGDPVTPDGESYQIERDRAEHQDRAQSYIEDSDRR